MSVKRNHDQFLHDLTDWCRQDPTEPEQVEPTAWISLNSTERQVIIEQWHMDEGKPSQLCRMIEAKLKELNT